MSSALPNISFRATRGGGGRKAMAGVGGKQAEAALQAPRDGEDELRTQREIAAMIRKLQDRSGREQQLSMVGQAWCASPAVAGRTEYAKRCRASDTGDEIRKQAVARLEAAI